MGAILITLVIIILFFIVIEFNTFVNLKNKIKQSKSSIDIYLTQRFDLIPNLVECVKVYMKYEESVFTKIAELRAEYNNSKDLKKGEQLNSEFNNLLAVGESNPDLKASEQFLDLQKSLITYTLFRETSKQSLLFELDLDHYHTLLHNGHECLQLVFQVYLVHQESLP